MGTADGVSSEEVTGGSGLAGEQAGWAAGAWTLDFMHQTQGLSAGKGPDETAESRHLVLGKEAMGRRLRWPRCHQDGQGRA